MQEKKNAPWPYRNDGQAFVGEGRGAPEATVKPKPKEKTSLKKREK